jgi:hypothetical protein
MWFVVDVVVVCSFIESISLCSQAGLGLVDFLLLPPECWNYRLYITIPVKIQLFEIKKKKTKVHSLDECCLSHRTFLVLHGSHDSSTTEASICQSGFHQGSPQTPWEPLLKDSNMTSLNLSVTMSQARRLGWMIL